MNSTSLSQTRSIAEGFLNQLKSFNNQATVVGLKGDLGAGKTAFVQQIANILGVIETITSPTFVIEKIYKLDHSHYTHLVHIDAYRLEKSAELLSLGWQEIIANPKHLIMIEWPEKVRDIMPKETKYISFTFINETTRDISYE